MGGLLPAMLSDWMKSPGNFISLGTTEIVGLDLASESRQRYCQKWTTSGIFSCCVWPVLSQVIFWIPISWDAGILVIPVTSWDKVSKFGFSSKKERLSLRSLGNLVTSSSNAPFWFFNLLALSKLDDRAVPASDMSDRAHPSHSSIEFAQLRTVDSEW